MSELPKDAGNADIAAIRADIAGIAAIRADIAAIRAALLDRFDRAARPLPWRSSRDPYAILVSEVMSQQTRVETVIPYYERWLERYPDIEALADAPADDVLKSWEGLGYYSRARNLHAAARVIRERHGGAIPAAYDDLRSLPGVGEYTAGAVASIAFGQARAAIDGNVRRVLARLLDEPAPTAARLRSVAAALVPDERPGDFNQALMELGATVCTPRSPRCTRCPIARWCGARAAGTQEQRPAPRPSRAVPNIDMATAVLHDAVGRLLLVRRPSRGLLADMWSFPAAELNGADPVARALDVARRHAPQPGDPVPLGTVEHQFSHRREHYQCFLIACGDTGDHGNVGDVADAGDDSDAGDPGDAGVAGSGEARWVGDAEVPPALPRAQQRIRALALAALDGATRSAWGPSS